MDKNTEQFQWTNELVMEFVNFHCEQKGIHWLSEDIEKFKQSKSKKEEPQWEILEFLDSLGNSLVLDENKWKYRNDTNSISDIDFLIKNYAIHSVKRFPDNTVWSVDKRYFINGYMCTLKKFQLSEGGKMIVYFNGIDMGYILSELPTEQAPKEEQVPIKVKDIFDGIKIKNLPFGKYYTLVTNNPIPESKYQPIKEAIEKILNNEDWTMEFAQKMVKEVYAAELLQARRDAFDAARKIVFMFSAFPIRHPFKYLKFEDYINSLK